MGIVKRLEASIAYLEMVREKSVEPYWESSENRNCKHNHARFCDASCVFRTFFHVFVIIGIRRSYAHG